MSLLITDLSGVDLRAQPPVARDVFGSSTFGGFVSIECLITESDPLLYDYISATIYWNDGDRPEVIPISRSSLLVNRSRLLAPGTYIIQLVAGNYAAVLNQRLSVNFSVTVHPQLAAPISIPIVYGPILPKDSGFPNAQQWDWNSGADLDVLASSIKMLLLTGKGERIMLPAYGTNLRDILFEVQGGGLQSVVQQEIAMAVSLWEPRVTVQNVTVLQTGDRELTVTATFISKLSQKTFTVPTVYTQ